MADDDLFLADTCNVIAGPTVSSILSRFGAEVVKIDPPKPSYGPSTTINYGLAANRGKRQSVLLDLKAPSARPALAKLLKWADVVTVNVPPSQLPSLGLAPEQLAEATGIEQAPILMHFDAMGGPAGDFSGERSDAVGYDDCLQAALGIMSRFGGSMER